jgi:hypothetical protein
MVGVSLDGRDRVRVERRAEVEFVTGVTFKQSLTFHVEHFASTFVVGQVGNRTHE